MVQFCHNYFANEWTSKHIKNNHQKQQKIDKKKNNHPDKTHQNYPQKCWNAPCKHVTNGTYPSSPLLFLHLQQTYL